VGFLSTRTFVRTPRARLRLGDPTATSHPIARWSDQVIRGDVFKYSLVSIELARLFFVIGLAAPKARAH
jgi:hypothetical protein